MPPAVLPSVLGGSNLGGPRNVGCTAGGAVDATAVGGGAGDFALVGIGAGWNWGAGFAAGGGNGGVGFAEAMCAAAKPVVMPSTPAFGIGGAEKLSGRALAVGPLSECVDESGETVMVLVRLEALGEVVLAAVLTG